MIGSEWFASRPGGLNRYFESLARALAAEPGVEVDGWAFGTPPPGGRSVGPIGLGTAARALARPGVAADVDVLDRHFALYGVRARVRKDALRVFHFHGPWAAESAMSRESSLAISAKAAIERAVYARQDRFVTLSEAFRTLLAERYSVPLERISVIPPGVDLERFTVGRPSTDRPTVLCVRRLERRMGVQVLLDAWPAIVAAVPDARLRIVGTGSFEAELRERAAASQLAGSVAFLGRLDDDALAAEYADATVTVVPSIALEGFGLIALESLANGRAPVVTEVGGLPDSVRGLDPSLVVPPLDAEALAVRLVAALAGEHPAAAVCRTHAERFSWAETARQHVRLYRADQGA